MGLRDVKKELNKLDQSGMIKLITEMYKTIPEVKDYLDVYSTANYDHILKKYTKQIERKMTPNASTGYFNDADARKLVRKACSMKIDQLSIDLELFYVECCLDLISVYGMSEDSFYVSTANAFYRALAGIQKLADPSAYGDRLNAIVARAGENYLDLEYYE